MKFFALAISALFIGNLSANAQGCVAIRSAGGMCMANHTGDEHNAAKWTLNVNNRYFKSYKHFRGLHEEKQRVQNNTEVKNQKITTDITKNRKKNNITPLYLVSPTQITQQKACA